MPYEFTCSNTQQHRVDIQPVKADNVTPAAVDGPATGEPSDANHVVGAGRGDLNLVVVPNDGFVGEIRGLFVVDADRGPGVRRIVVEYVGQITDEEAAAVNVSGSNELKGTV